MFAVHLSVSTSIRSNMKLAALLLPLIFAACETLPKDQWGTFDRIKSTKEIRVGLIEEEPFVENVNGDPSGIEVELIKRFAESVGARPVWTHGSDERLMKSLEHFQLDLVAGGITDSTPWAKHVGITSPYRNKQVFAVAPGENELVRRLDDFTYAHKGEIEQMFADQGVSK